MSINIFMIVVLPFQEQGDYFYMRNQKNISIIKNVGNRKETSDSMLGIFSFD